MYLALAKKAERPFIQHVTKKRIPEYRLGLTIIRAEAARCAESQQASEPLIPVVPSPEMKIKMKFT
jgi:hypothetical protein